MDIDMMTCEELIRELVRIIKQIKDRRSIKMLYGFAIILKEQESVE